MCDLPPTEQHVVVSTSRSSRFYMLPKIHKSNNPARPIMSACCCPSTYLHEVMALLVRCLPTDLRYQRCSQNPWHLYFDCFDENPRFLFTMVILSLYTVIPNNVLQALSPFFGQRTNKDPPTLTRLAELVLTYNAFLFNGECYCQIGGVTMRSDVGVSYTYLYVGFSLKSLMVSYQCDQFCYPDEIRV